MKSNAEELRIISRRSKVAAMIVRGQTNHYEITRQLGMEDTQRSTVSRDIKAIKEEWRQSAVRDFDEAKGRELAKLDEIEKEYWSAWERSRTERQTTRAKQRRHGKDAGDDTETELKKEHRDGNPAFLAGVLDCVMKRCEIMGLNAPVKNQHTGPGGGPIQSMQVTLELTPDERAEALANLFARVGARGHGPNPDEPGNALGSPLGQAGDGSDTGGHGPGPLASEVTPLDFPPATGPVQ